MTTENKNTPVPALLGQATEEQIAQWKKDNPLGIYFVKVPGQNMIIYFKHPTLDDLNCCYAKTDWNRQMDKWKTLADVTYLGGHEDILKNDRLFISIVPRLQEAAQGEETEMGNL